MTLFFSKTGGFKLAVEKRKGYTYEIAAVLLSVILLVVIGYCLFFISNLLRNIFAGQIISSQPVVKFDLGLAKQINKLNLYLSHPELLKRIETFGLASSTEPLVTPMPR